MADVFDKLNQLANKLSRLWPPKVPLSGWTLEDALVVTMVLQAREEATLTQLKADMAAVGFRVPPAVLASQRSDQWSTLVELKSGAIQPRSHQALLAHGTRLLDGLEEEIAAERRRRTLTANPIRPTAGPGRKTPPKASRNTAGRAVPPASAAPASIRPTPAPAPASPPTPPPEAFPWSPAPTRLDFSGLTAAVAQLFRVAPSPWEHTRLTLAAHALAGAERFEELLSLGGLRGVEPHGYQQETVRRVLRTFGGRALLADEVGLGKTVEALITLREYQLRGMVQRALLLVPSALVRQWAGEFASKVGVEVFTTDDALAKEDPEAFWGRPGITVASLPLARLARHLPLVQARPWDMLVVDEAHHIKNRASASWKLVDGIKSRFLLLLTATPVEKDLEEIYNMVTLLRPGQLSTPAEFRKQYVDAKNPTAPRNRERLRSLLSEVMVRNTRAQSGLALPPRFVTTLLAQPTAAESALYQGVVDFFRAHHADTGLRLAATTLLLQAGSSTAALRTSMKNLVDAERTPAPARKALRALLEQSSKVVQSRKLDALVDLLRNTPDKVLVFSRFRETVAAVTDAVTAAGFAAVGFHGGMDRAEKAEARDRFEGDARVMVATDVGAEGLNLQFCHVLANFDLPWNPMLLEQRIGRLHRMGQTREVRVFNLCARGTMEERILGVLHDRLHLFELVVGEMDMVLGNMSDDEDFEERVLKVLAASTSEQEVDAGMEALAQSLVEAKGHYADTKALETALFGEEFEA